MVVNRPRPALVIVRQKIGENQNLPIFTRLSHQEEIAMPMFRCAASDSGHEFARQDDDLFTENVASRLTISIPSYIYVLI